MMGPGNRTVGDWRAPSILGVCVGWVGGGIWCSGLGRRRVRPEQ